MRNASITLEQKGSSLIDSVGASTYLRSNGAPQVSIRLVLNGNRGDRILTFLSLTELHSSVEMNVIPPKGVEEWPPFVTSEHRPPINSEADTDAFSFGIEHALLLAGQDPFNATLLSGAWAEIFRKWASEILTEPATDFGIYSASVSHSKAARLKQSLSDAEATLSPEVP